MYKFTINSDDVQYFHDAVAYLKQKGTKGLYSKLWEFIQNYEEEAQSVYRGQDFPYDFVEGAEDFTFCFGNKRSYKTVPNSYLEAFKKLRSDASAHNYPESQETWRDYVRSVNAKHNTSLINGDDNSEVNNDDNERESETMIKAEEIAEILTDNLRYVEVKFPKTIDKTYIYKVPHEVPSLVVGDKVLIGNIGNIGNPYVSDERMEVVEVTAIYNNYNEVPVDKKSLKFKYIINKIDFTPHSNAIKLEKEIVDFVNVKQREAIRNQLRDAVTNQFPELQKLVEIAAPKK